MHATASIRRANEVLGVSRHVQRVSDLFSSKPRTTSLADSSSSSSFKDFVRGIHVEPRHDVPDGAGTIIGAATGAYLCRDSHVVLGTIGGASLGRNVPALFTADRGIAVGNLATTALAITVSRTWVKHPFLGYVIGEVIGSVLLNMGDSE